MTNLRILAIEDDFVHADAIRSHVEALGYILIDVVKDTAEFKRLVTATKPDLLLLDIHLNQQVDGIELTREISKETDIPFVFITSLTDKEVVSRAVDTLPAAYITKPINQASLQAAIELARASQTQQQPVQVDNTVKSFFLNTGEKLIRLELTGVLFAEADNKSLKIYTEDEQNKL